MKNNKLFHDERKDSICWKSLGIAGIVLFFCITVSQINEFLNGHVSWEIYACFGYILLTVALNRLLGNIEYPKSILGKELPLGNNNADKRVRIKDYFFRGFIFSVSLSITTFFMFVFNGRPSASMRIVKSLLPSLSNIFLAAISTIITLLLLTMICWAAEYIIGEKIKLKKYRELFEDNNEE